MRIMTGSDVSIVFSKEYRFSDILLNLTIAISLTEALKFHFRAMGSAPEILKILEKYSGKDIRITAPGILIDGYMNFSTEPLVEKDGTCEFYGFFCQKDLLKQP